jgi:RimJ/RimL family protein N-acetyltransferase
MNKKNTIILIPMFYHEIYLKLISNWRNMPEIKKTLRSYTDTNQDGQKDFIERIRKSDDMYYYIMQSEVNDSSYTDKEYSTDNRKYINTLVGYCGLDKLHFANRTAEISLLIAPQFQRAGHGKDAVKLLLQKAFNEVNLNLVFAETYFGKDFWIKCGFKQEGVLRDRKYHDNDYHDSYLLSIIREEFYK